uniref:Uncharacterized protein n=1 Tax=Sphaerodactylus townsendi TaxID=933632 RepID=A0ACB8FJN5_9SAUR
MGREEQPSHFCGDPPSGTPGAEAGIPEISLDRLKGKPPLEGGRILDSPPAVTESPLHSCPIQKDRHQPRLKPTLAREEPGLGVWGCITHPGRMQDSKEVTHNPSASGFEGPVAGLLGKGPWLPDSLCRSSRHVWGHRDTQGFSFLSLTPQILLSCRTRSHLEFLEDIMVGSLLEVGLTFRHGRCGAPEVRLSVGREPWEAAATQQPHPKREDAAVSWAVGALGLRAEGGPLAPSLAAQRLSRHFLPATLTGAFSTPLRQSLETWALPGAGVSSSGPERREASNSSTGASPGGLGGFQILEEDVLASACRGCSWAVSPGFESRRRHPAEAVEVMQQATHYASPTGKGRSASGQHASVPGKRGGPGRLGLLLLYASINQAKPLPRREQDEDYLEVGDVGPPLSLYNSNLFRRAGRCRKRSRWPSAQRDRVSFFLKSPSARGKRQSRRATFLHFYKQSSGF